jgi:hypothetical protein
MLQDLAGAQGFANTHENQRFIVVEGAFKQARNDIASYGTMFNTIAWLSFGLRLADTQLSFLPTYSIFVGKTGK